MPAWDPICSGLSLQRTARILFKPALPPSAPPPDSPVFFKALPILGRDGTLAKIQTANPGAGHVFAKTGTFDSEDRLNGKLMLNGKGLAGYVLTASGQKLVFAAYVNHVSLPADPEAARAVGGQALG